MNYYLVAVGDISAKQVANFTYQSSDSLQAGHIVAVPFKKSQAFGVVIKKVAKPKFTTKALTFLSLQLPAAQFKTLLWGQTFYPTEVGAWNRLFLPTSSETSRSRQRQTISPATIKSSASFQLTNEQSQAIELIDKSPHISLLHGETGTGKTQVFIELIKAQLGAGKSVILLSPEIGLSGQLTDVIGKQIDGVITYSSMLTNKERRDIWCELSSSLEPHVIIGPRSSLFLPAQNLGLVIIDEAHDQSYKQQQSPYYTSLQVAAKLTAETKAKLVYGSATPNTSDYFTALNRGYPIARMLERPVQTITESGTTFEIIDTQDKTKFQQNKLISDQAIKKIQHSTKQGWQSLVLLNRRGTAQIISCETCNWQYRCENCDHGLVYHHDKYQAVCHYCDRHYSMPTSCPEDGGAVRLLSVGTKYIEELLQHLIPDAVISRIDADSMEKAVAREKIVEATSGKAQILVGTQLIAKGLDLPYLENILIVDAFRQSNDFLGDERFYQLLHQVIGRGKRGHRAVHTILQTSEPDDPIINWAINENWQAMYEQELIDRQRYHYPPYNFLAVLYFERKDLAAAEKISLNLSKKIAALPQKIEFHGPLPGYSHNKTKKQWLIILKSASRPALVEAVMQAPSDFSADLDPISL